uniref:Uncharacterized protein n=1 Tax=Noctiluca scintillans TaxID=2966 RepID=A0A6T8ZUN3_NOCSC|eukprot:CAMPEP_0194503268 /NCGR_PEP_ID=MMETSP0253-20130528/28286_1 /TAXON_ID=2966 /ORGANISM="Noctiluca scintillans" /LENGTH=350 /DNA_ID=CAMNT_0039345539 /DNA_START=57 /DNA_END=1109 /DNA_ORIENTATION=+
MGLNRALKWFVFSPLWVVAVRYNEEFDQFHRLKHRVEARQRVNANVKNTEVPEELSAVLARLQKAKTLLDAKLQEQADAKAKGVMLSTEDRHALSDAQQDAAVAQKEMHEIRARVGVNTATLRAAQSEVRTASSPPQEELTTAQQRFEKANQMLEVKMREQAEAMAKGLAWSTEQRMAVSEAQADAAKAQNEVKELRAQLAGNPKKVTERPTDASNSPESTDNFLARMADGVREASLAMHDAQEALAEQAARVEEVAEIASAATLVAQKQKLKELHEKASIAQHVLGTFTHAVERQRRPSGTDKSKNITPGLRHAMEEAESLQAEAENAALRWLDERLRTRRLQDLQDGK